MIYPNKIVLAKYLALLICISSCSVKTKSQHKLTTDNLKCNIVDIKEFDRSYRFTAIDDFGNKIIIISYYLVYFLDKIVYCVKLIFD